MDKFTRSQHHEVLDDDILEMLVEAQQPVMLSEATTNRMRNGLLDAIQQEKEVNAKTKGFETLLAHEGEWIEAMPGAQFKVLHDDGNGLDGLLSYLIKLEPGVSMKGHNHPFDEECLMLEGDLTLGEHTLNKGDFHFANAGVPHGDVSTQNGCIAFIRGALPV